MKTSVSRLVLNPGRHLCLAAGALFVALSTWHAWDVSAPGPVDRSGRLEAPDFVQFYTYGTLAREGSWHRLYESAAHEDAASRALGGLSLDGLLPNYPPLVAWLAQPLSVMPYTQAVRLFSVLTMVLYLAAVCLLRRETAQLREHVALVNLAALAFPALFVVLRYGQLSALSLLLLSISAAVAGAGRMLLAGIAVGLLAYKPNLLVVPLLALVGSRQWGLATGLVIGMAGELSASVAIAGVGPTMEYLRTLMTLAIRPDLVQFYPAESHSARGFVKLLTGEGVLVFLVGMLAPLVAGWAVYRVWRTHTDWRPRWAALVLGALLGSPHLLTYDLLLLVVPLVLTIDWRLATGCRLDGAWLWSLVGCYFAAWPGTFIARLLHVQTSTIAMALLLVLLMGPRATDRA